MWILAETWVMINDHRIAYLFACRNNFLMWFLYQLPAFYQRGMLQLQLPLPPLGSTVELPPPPPPWTVGMRGVVKVDSRFVGLSYNIIIIETHNSGSAHNILSKISCLLYVFLWSSNALINLKLQASLPPPSPPPTQHFHGHLTSPMS